MWHDLVKGLLPTSLFLNNQGKRRTSSREPAPTTGSSHRTTEFGTGHQYNHHRMEYSQQHCTQQQTRIQGLRISNTKVWSPFCSPHYQDYHRIQGIFGRDPTSTMHHCRFQTKASIRRDSFKRGIRHKVSEGDRIGSLTGSNMHCRNGLRYPYGRNSNPGKIYTEELSKLLST